MAFPSPAIVGSDFVGVEGKAKINAHLADGSQHLPMLQTISDLRAMDASSLVTGQLVGVLGYYARGDGGGGTFMFDPAATISASVNTTTDLFTATNHGFYTGQPVRVYGTSLPGGIANSTTTYYARFIDFNTFALHATFAETRDWLWFAVAGQIDVTNDKFLKKGHGLVNGEKVRVGTADLSIPAGLAANTSYFVVQADINGFKVSLTSGGAAVNITTEGSYAYVYRAPIDITSTGTAVSVNQADDGGMWLVPNANPASGRWRRLVDDPRVARNTHFGATHDGVTDDTAANIAAINYIAGLTESVDLQPQWGLKGAVIFAAGTSMTNKLPVYSKVAYVGSGVNATTIKLRAAQNTAVFESYLFDRLTGSQSEFGEYSFDFRDMTIDGNYVNNTTGNDGVKLYGHGWRMSNMIIGKAKRDGLVTEWYITELDSTRRDDSYGVEAYLDNVTISESGRHGWNMGGPHDTTAVNLISRVSGHDDPTGCGLWVKTTGGLYCTNSHFYHHESLHALKVDSAYNVFVNCQFEGGTQSCVNLNGWGNNFIGCNVFVPQGFGLPNIGFEMGSAADPNGGARCNIECRVTDLMAGIVKFYPGVLSTVYYRMRFHGEFSSAGTLISGTPPTTLDVEFQIDNTAGGKVAAQSRRALVSASPMAAEQTRASSSTIVIGEGESILPVAHTSGAITGIKMPAGIFEGQTVTIVNRSTSTSITFDTVANGSLVAAGSQSIIALGEAARFVWDSNYAGAGTGRWVSIGA